MVYIWHYTFVKTQSAGTPLAVQWLRFFTPDTGDTSLTPGWELRSHTPYHTTKKKKNLIALYNTNSEP